MRLLVGIPFEGDEASSFESFMETRGAKKGPFFRQLVLTLMDPSTGPIIEAAMRGRAAPDLRAGQARETAEAVAALAEESGESE